MNCPWCSFDGAPRALRDHVGDRHGEVVTTSSAAGEVYYQVTCPRCGASYRRRMRKAARDPDFLAAYRSEITAVAVDMLVHHLTAEHAAEMTAHADQTGEGRHGSGE